MKHARKMMRFILLGFLLIIACNAKQSHQQFDLIRKQLTGEWEQIGLFEQETPMYDTLYYKFSDADGIIDKVTYGIWADSGKYEHVYSAEMNALLGVDTVSQIEIYHFVFLTDSSGVLQHSSVEIGQRNHIGNREIDYTLNFQLVMKDSSTYLHFDSNDRMRDENIARIVFKADRLELEWSDLITEKFIRLGSK